MAYDYPYEKVLVQDDDDFVVAAHHNAQENQIAELTEAVKALDDFKAEFPAKAGDGGKLVAVNGTEDGYEYIDPPSGGGLLEPGLIAYIDSDFIYEGGGPGFSFGLPLGFITTRQLDWDGGPEEIHLLVATDAPAWGIVGTIPGDSAWGPAWYETDVWFDLGPGQIVWPYGYNDILARIGVWNSAEGAWVDLTSVHIVVSGGLPL